MTRTILLVRHPPVDDRFRSICYGFSDIPLGSHGHEMLPEISLIVNREPIALLVHSGLARAGEVAEAIARFARTKIHVDPRLRERNFGAWEGRSWDEIFTDTGDEMMRMISDPEHWSPPGGETTFQLRDRILEWYRDLPREGRIVAVSHGGPIAALRGTLSGLPVEEWPNLIPTPGSVFQLE